MPPKKGQKMSLAELSQKLDDEGVDAPTVTNWADDDIVLPSAPTGQIRPLPTGSSGGNGGYSSMDYRPGRAPRGPGRDEAPLPVAIDHSALPRRPPFMAFVGNLPFDVTEDDVREFFEGIAMKGVRFPRAGDSGTPRGFGYAEFHSVEGLTEALLRSGRQLKGRAVRVDLATSKGGEEGKFASVNWREGHQVVEREERSAPTRTMPLGSSTSLAKGDWRSTAKAVEAEAPQVEKVPGRKPILPRSAPAPKEEGEKLASEVYNRSNKPNPFGNAKPREVVLAHKDTPTTAAATTESQ